MTTLQRVAPTVRRLVVVCAAVLLVFSLAATQLVAARSTRCADAARPAGAPCAGASVDAGGVARVRATLSPLLHMDDVPHAALTLFAVATLDGWPAVARPFAEAEPALLLLITAWVAVAALLLRNLVTAAVVDGYVRVSLALEGRQMGEPPKRATAPALVVAHVKDASATHGAKEAPPRLEHALTEDVAVKPPSALRAAALVLVARRWFEPAVGAAVGLNALLVALKYAGQPPALDALQVRRCTLVAAPCGARRVR